MTDTGAGTPGGEAFEAALAKVAHGEPFGAEGIRIAGGAIARLIDAAPERDGRRVLPQVSFVGVTFVGPVSFADVMFEGRAWFGWCTFEDRTSFRNATFAGYSGFSGATFKGSAYFDGATFRDRADFQETTWKRGGAFTDTTFARDARFEGPTVFHEEARFDRATFGGDLFAPRTCRADLWFDRALFDTPSFLGPVTVDGRVILDGAVFSQPITIALRARALCASGTQFRAGADILAQSATVALDGASFGAPSTLSAATHDSLYGALLSAADGDEQTIPRVVSLLGARVAELTLSGVDLRACRFRGAHGLDRLQLEQVVFAETPRGWYRTASWPFFRRWTRRLAVAEEHRWRAEGQRVPGWWTKELQVASEGPIWREPDRPTPHQVAAVYRALRKGQEERKDEPGAADFYYGEMEMRRLTRLVGGLGDDGALTPGEAPAALPLHVRSHQDSTRRAPLSESPVLSLYWLVSGYGLRPSRALFALGVTVACGAFLLAAFGFEHDRSYGRSVLFALESSISLLRAPTARLTPGGELVAISLRLLGPLLFGLALLALRGRVKR
jgi:uncharacterized protein YjbI with pentapeptide repeats